MLTPTTTLDAVNTILSTIGGSPVSQVEGSGIDDADIAYRLLVETTRRVCLRSYDWNTDDNYSLAPDANGHINVPATALDVDPEDGTTRAVVRTNPETGKRALWDKSGHTFQFAAAVPVRITWGFGFEELPEAARDYITISAGRTFQKRFVGSQVLDRYSAEDEMRAYAALRAGELRSRDFNLFRDNPSMARSNNRSY